MKAPLRDITASSENRQLRKRVRDLEAKTGTDLGTEESPQVSADSASAIRATGMAIRLMAMPVARARVWGQSLRGHGEPEVNLGRHVIRLS
eukprot:2118542-Rhodomonas_salina.2